MGSQFLNTRLSLAFFAGCSKLIYTLPVESRRYNVEGNDSLYLKRTSPYKAPVQGTAPCSQDYKSSASLSMLHRKKAAPNEWEPLHYIVDTTSPLGAYASCINDDSRAC